MRPWGVLRRFILEVTGGGGGGVDVEDDGAPVVSTSQLNFTGAGVTVTDNAGVADIDIPGGGGGAGIEHQFNLQQIANPFNYPGGGPNPAAFPVDTIVQDVSGIASVPGYPAYPSITIPVGGAGTWQIGMYVGFGTGGPTVGNVQYAMFLRLNGSTFLPAQRMIFLDGPPQASNGGGVNTYTFADGDVIEFLMSGSVDTQTRNINGGANGPTYIFGFKMSSNV